VHYHAELLAFVYPAGQAREKRRISRLIHRGVEATYRTMQHTWIKFVLDRNTYVVDLDGISSFARAENGRLMFSLPNAKLPVVIHPRNNPEAYQQILDYIEKTTGHSLLG